MNPVLKDVVYGKGTQRQIDFMAAIGGMNDEEKQLFQMLHEQKDEGFIMGMLSLTNRKSYLRIEEAVRAKLLIAIFECINQHMEYSEF